MALISGTTAVSLQGRSVDREESEHSMFPAELELMGSDVARHDGRDNSEPFEAVPIVVIGAFSAPVVVAGGDVLTDVAGVVSTEVLWGNKRVARVRTGPSGPVFKLGLDVAWDVPTSATIGDFWTEELGRG